MPAIMIDESRVINGKEPSHLGQAQVFSSGLARPG